MKANKKLLSFVLAVVMMLSVMAISASAAGPALEPVSIAEGEPVTIQWNEKNGTVVNVTGDSFIPASFVLWVEGTSTVTVDGTAVPSTMENTGNYGYMIHTGANAITIVVNITASNYGAVGTYTITCPPQNGSAPSSMIRGVTSYLPIGQFANNSPWGVAVGKFTNGFESTGASLGAAGGYVQMDLSAPIYNDDTNPYGVDFIVYGNAFNRNPEAGAVKVFGYTGAEDKVGGWYDLAGSLYYADKSINNATVSYKMVKNDGIFYQINGGSWVKFSSNDSWWPSTNSHGSTWGNVDGVTWDQANNIITFSGISLVKDTDTTNDYQFGYFDIHSNGSNYGVAVNPYTVTNTQTGGDGFDLAWAVDNTGKPVKLSHITKVRLYTTAALDATGNAFTVPAVFGETSAEVCGVYEAQGNGQGAMSAPLTIKLNDKYLDNILDDPTVMDSMGTVELSGQGNSVELNVSGAENIFINGERKSTMHVDLTDNKTHTVQIIGQEGTASPYVLCLKLSK